MANGYGMMPVAQTSFGPRRSRRRTSKAPFVVLGKLDSALYNPPIQPWARELPFSRTCCRAGQVIAGFPVGTSMDTPMPTAPSRHEPRREIWPRRTISSDKGLGGPRSRSAFHGRTPSWRTSIAAQAIPKSPASRPIFIPRRRARVREQRLLHRQNTYSSSYLSLHRYLARQAPDGGLLERGG